MEVKYRESLSSVSGETPTRDLLELRGVSKTYRTRNLANGVALSNADLSVKAGEFVSLVGPSGCGKTTLLKIAAGLTERTAGTLMFNGVQGSPPPDAMGVVFQSPVLLPWRTVKENILLPAQVQRKPIGPALKRVDHLLEMMQLSGTRDKYPTELSGGMQQRVAIARALLTSPELLFMDEPFGALDAMTREDLNLELQRIQVAENTTVVFVTHDIAESVFLSDRVAVMSTSPGRIVDVIDIPLERPRTPDILLTAEFRQLEATVRHTLKRNS